MSNLFYAKIMLRKLLFSFFSLLVFFLSLPLLYHKQTALALEKNCFGQHIVYTTDPSPITIGDSSAYITIGKQGDQLNDAKYKLSVSIKSGTPDASDYLKVIFDRRIQRTGDFPRFIDRAFYDGDARFTNSAVAFLTKTQSGTSQEGICTLPLGVSSAAPEDSCRVQITNDLKPGTGIAFKVNGLGNNDEFGRGVAWKNVDGNFGNGTCKKDVELSNGIVLQDGSMTAGRYALSITERCLPFLNMPDGKSICNTPIFLYLDPKGGYVEETECDPNNVDKTGKPKNAEECKGKTFPYCVEDPRNPGKGVCSKIPPIEDICKGSCKTAFGNFGYTPEAFAKSVLRLFLGIAGGIILLFLILNGYRLMTSQGDPEKVKEARESIISAVAGLLLIVFSLVILEFVTVRVLGLPGFNP